MLISKQISCLWKAVPQMRRSCLRIRLGVRSLIIVLAITVEVRQGKHTERFPLLAGALMNFPLGALPFQPGITVEDDELSLHLVPFRSRLQSLGLVASPQRNARTAKQFRITRETPVTLRVLNHDRMNFFIDEDPVEAREITLRVAGRLAFVPGKDFNPKRN